jgi:hypothetical protein
MSVRLLECPPRAKGDRRSLTFLIACRCRYQPKLDELRTVLEFHRLVTNKSHLVAFPQHPQVGPVFAGIRKMLAARNLDFGTARLFRQRTEGDWASIIDLLQPELNSLLRST